jgi:hypothetical protein
MEPETPRSIKKSASLINSNSKEKVSKISLNAASNND